MKNKKKIVLLGGLIFSTLFHFNSQAQEKNTISISSKEIIKVDATQYYKEPFRPQFHFSPEKKWMNDPNGMLFHNGTYHLFYQYYPEDIVWGPMHWGHATSKDLIHWQHKKIALFPDELGYIFSGSAVMDTNNTSGLGTKENPPMIAVFTYHNMEFEKAGKINTQTQGLAYSLDQGETWKKYNANPIINNITLKDFRDPKVFWNDTKNKWDMVLAAGDRIKIFSSVNLKDWTFESDFKPTIDDKDLGVWECPDLFKMKMGKVEKWVMIVSHGDKAPNGGSGTRYFIGDYDGKTFTNTQKAIWLDYGTDAYAGVTFSNTPNNKKILLAWMSNWKYANKTPTEVWRGAMTLPREVTLVNIAEKEWKLKSEIVREFESYKENKTAISKNNIVDDHLLIHQKNPLVCELNISFNRKPLKGEFTISISSPLACCSSPTYW